MGSFRFLASRPDRGNERGTTQCRGSQTSVSTAAGGVFWRARTGANQILRSRIPTVSRPQTRTRAIYARQIDRHAGRRREADRRPGRRKRSARGSRSAARCGRKGQCRQGIQRNVLQSMDFTAQHRPSVQSSVVNLIQRAGLCVVKVMTENARSVLFRRPLAQKRLVALPQVPLALGVTTRGAAGPNAPPASAMLPNPNFYPFYHPLTLAVWGMPMDIQRSHPSAPPPWGLTWHGTMPSLRIRGPWLQSSLRSRLALGACPSLSG